jgi:hypothetical protein
METGTTPVVNTPQSQMPMHPEFHHWLRYAVVAFLILFMAVGGMYLLSSRQKNVSNDSNSTADVSPQPVRSGTMKVVPEKSGSYTVGKEVAVFVTGDSQGKDVVGYDILLTYDPNILSVPVVTSSDTSFQVTSFTKKKGFVSITGTKTANNQSTNVFKNTQLVKLVFNATKKGTVNVAIKQQVNKEQTKFVDATFQHLYPQVGLVTLEVL